MVEYNIITSLRIIVIAVIAYIVISSWSRVLDQTVFKYFNLDRNAIIPWLVIATVSTLLLLFILYLLNIGAHDILGISEQVGIQLNKQTP